eukprot:scaffold54405_cov55-Phaeocystis_antarctica.AAC.15
MSKGLRTCASVLRSEKRERYRSKEPAVERGWLVHQCGAGSWWSEMCSSQPPHCIPPATKNAGRHSRLEPFWKHGLSYVRSNGSGRYLATSGAACWMILCRCASGSLVARTLSPSRRASTPAFIPCFHSIRQMRKKASTKPTQPNRPLMLLPRVCCCAARGPRRGERKLALSVCLCLERADLQCSYDTWAMHALRCENMGACIHRRVASRFPPCMFGELP